MQIRDRVRELRRVKAGELVPNPKNWRTHPKAQADALRGILAEVGYADALLARELPDGSLILVDGHLRAETTPEQEVPVLVLDINEAEADKLLLSLDPLAALAETNAVALDALLREVDTGSEGLQQMYADLAEAADLYQDADKEVVEDEVPEPPADPITKPGDLWLLGEHRLLCGDSTKAEDVERLMEGAKADMMVTDPPYNVEYEGNYIQSGRILKKEQKVWSGGIANDNLSNFGEWLASVFAACDAAIDAGSAIYVWHPPGEDGKYFWSAWPYDKWHFQVDLVWNKTSLIISRWDYKPQHELCMYGWKGKNRSWIGPNNEPTVWDIPRQQGASGELREHPTQKPVECMARAIRNHDGSVYDPFLGSGTTLIAAEQLGRKCYGMEISPAYCDVIVNRWETLTGKKAELEVHDGQARAATGADNHQDGEGQPRQKAAQPKRAKAAKR